MKRSLLTQALSKFALGLALVCVLLFVPAGTLHWWRGWLLLAVLFVPMFAAGCCMLYKNPKLLEKRLSAREQEAEQREAIFLSGIMFAAAFLAAGLNFRFSWLPLPDWFSWLAALALLAGYLLFARVLRENTWLSRSVEVQEGQRLVDTGLYGIVRHPMYTATLLLFLSMPLVLGSLPSFAILMFYPPLIAKRIENEEMVLEEGLEGYGDYKRRVKYRLVPYIW